MKIFITCSWRSRKSTGLYAISIQ